MFEPLPTDCLEVTWSDRYGIIERDPAVAFPRGDADPRDRATHGIVAQHDPQVSVQRGGGTEVQNPCEAEQAGCVCGEAVWLAAGLGR